MKKQYLIATAIAAIVLISSTSHHLKILGFVPLVNDCLELPETYFNYANIQLPPYLNAPNIQNADNTPAGNPITDAGATLGRVLFYDNKLSLTNTHSCASCHQQANGFTDGSQFSRGFLGGFTGRNSMSLAMARYYNNGHFFWDERAATLEDQVLMPIQDPVEMGMTLDEMVVKLSVTDYYPPLFEAAFGTPEVSADRVSKALAQFVRSMVSFGSKYDTGRGMMPPGAPPTQPFPNFSPEENLGKAIFFDPQRGNCASCHGTDAFIAMGPKNNGLEIMITDPGLGAVTGNPEDAGLFKVPSLRNVELSAPYMHDGSIETLEDVILHYDHDVKPHPNLSPEMRIVPNGPPRFLSFTPEDRAALLAFLKTLTDNDFITDERWSNPFCNTTDTHNTASADRNLKVFPNPSSGKSFRVRLPTEGDYTLQLLGLSGQLLQSVRFRGTVYDFKVAGIPPGVYFLQVNGEDGQMVQKIVLE